MGAVLFASVRELSLSPWFEAFLHARDDSSAGRVGKPQPSGRTNERTASTNREGLNGFMKCA